MSSRSTKLACILATTTAAVNGFSPSQHILPPRTPISKLQAATTTINESQYPNLLSQASLCADDESCSIEAANLYLKEIVHYQSGCAAGTLSGNDVCEDVVGVSEVVANLRHKIDNSNGVNKVEKNDRLVESIAFATLYALVAGIVLSQPHLDGNVVPFTVQEVFWAIKDGYAGDLATHYFHNGGLLVGDALSSSVRGMTPQELLWSARDGYMFSSYGLDGGVESLPLTPQEVWWSIKDGYVTDLAGHYFRNGGL